MLNAIQSTDSNALLLQLWRNATNRSHKEIEETFSHTDRNSQVGYARFLSARLAGITPASRTFSEEESQVPPPDFLATVRLDLVSRARGPVSHEEAKLQCASALTAFDVFPQALQATDSQIVTLG